MKFGLLWPKTGKDQEITVECSSADSNLTGAMRVFHLIKEISIFELAFGTSSFLVLFGTINLRTYKGLKNSKKKYHFCRHLG